MVKTPTDNSNRNQITFSANKLSEARCEKKEFEPF